MEAKNGKGQVSSEYLIMAGVVIGAAIIIFYNTMLYSSESISVSQAGESAESLARAVDYVYALGPGTKSVVEIDIPSNVVDSFVVPNEVGFKIGLSSGVRDIVAVTEADAVGSIPIGPGRQYILVNYTETGVVIAPL